MDIYAADLSDIKVSYSNEYVRKDKESITTKDHIFIIGAGIFGSGIIYYKKLETGWLSYVISAMAGILIILLSILILEDENDEDNEDVNTRVQ
ncbi:MAG: hypothetical protein K8R25_08620 [Methanosarcinales archaeon]|nr:hypothetical protein [Methanosarcinales archaeon]